MTSLKEAPAQGSQQAGGVAALFGRTRGQTSLRPYTLLVIVILSWVVLNVLTGGIFLSQRNLGLLALQTSITAMAAISAVMLMVTANFDLSTGSAVALVGVVVAYITVVLHLDSSVAILAAIAVGMVMGAWQGLWVRIGVPSFIVTLAGQLYFRGISLAVTKGETIGPVPSGMTSFATGYLAPELSIALIAIGVGAFIVFQLAAANHASRLGLLTAPRIAAFRASVPALLFAVPAIWIASSQGIPYLILLLSVLLLIAEVIMRRTAFGAHLYAIGGNPEAARLTGINIGRTVFRDFLLAGFMYGVIGVALTARLGGAVAGSAGLSLEFDAITAAVVGGTSLFGGRGTIMGALLGSLLVGGLANGMSLLNVPIYYQQITKGVVLLLVVAADFIGRHND